MADDRQIADIWRTQYTGPLFRKYTGLEQVPEVSIGYLARQSRLAVDFCQKMMAPLDLKQYAVNTPVFLPSGEQGMMRTKVIAGFGGTPIVLTRVDLERKVAVIEKKEEEEEKEWETAGLFYYYDPLTEVGKVIDYVVTDGVGSFVVTDAPPTIQVQYGLEISYNVFEWTGQNVDDVAVIVGNRLYGVNAKLIAELPPTDTYYRLAFRRNGTYYLAEADVGIKKLDGTLIYPFDLFGSIIDVNRSASEVLVHNGSDAYQRLSFTEEEELALVQAYSSERIFITDDQSSENTSEPSSFDAQYEETCFFDGSDCRPVIDRTIFTPRKVLTKIDITQVTTQLEYMWFNGDAVEQRIQNYTFNYNRDYKEEGQATDRLSAYAWSACEPKLGDASCKIIEQVYREERYLAAEQTDHAYQTESTLMTRVYPNFTVTYRQHSASKRDRNIPDGYYRYLKECDTENAECIMILLFGQPLFCFVEGLVCTETIEGDWNSIFYQTCDYSYKEDSFIAYDGWAHYVYDKFGVAVGGDWSETVSIDVAHAKCSDPKPTQDDYKISEENGQMGIYHNQVLLLPLPALPYNARYDPHREVFNNDGCLFFVLRDIGPENFNYRAFVFYDGILTELTSELGLAGAMPIYWVPLMMPLRATTIQNTYEV